MDKQMAFIFSEELFNTGSLTQVTCSEFLYREGKRVEAHRWLCQSTFLLSLVTSQEAFEPISRSQKCNLKVDPDVV